MLTTEIHRFCYSQDIFMFILLILEPPRNPYKLKNNLQCLSSICYIHVKITSRFWQNISISHYKKAVSDRELKSNWQIHILFYIKENMFLLCSMEAASEPVPLPGFLLLESFLYFPLLPPLGGVVNLTVQRPCVATYYATQGPPSEQDPSPPFLFHLPTSDIGWVWSSKADCFFSFSKFAWLCGSLY